MNVFTLGLNVPFWAKADFPDLPSVGRFEGDVFDPERWVPEYPNPAFVNRLPDDEFWGAKQVIALTDAQIRAIVSTGEYSDPRAAEHIAVSLIKRRDKIGKAYFAKVLPLDHFGVRDGRLVFDDIGERHRIPSGAPFTVQWYSFDNETEKSTPVPSASDWKVPEGPGYWLAEIRSAARPKQMVKVYVRENQRIAGVERTW
jgi:hypothetical protein